MNTTPESRKRPGAVAARCDAGRGRPFAALPGDHVPGFPVRRSRWAGACSLGWLAMLFFFAHLPGEPALAAPGKTPAIIEKGGTAYLNDPELLAEKPMLLPTPLPTPSPTPRPRPSPRSREVRSADEKVAARVPAGSLRATRITQPGPPISPGTPTRRSSEAELVSPRGSGLIVETTTPYPTRYVPPRFSMSPCGASVIIPATPTRFAQTPAGIRFDGNSFRSREFQGFVNYGSPIRTFAPVYDAQGRAVGLQVFETQSPVLQPVFRTIEIRR